MKKIISLCAATIFACFIVSFVAIALINASTYDYECVAISKNTTLSDNKVIQHNGKRVKINTIKRTQLNEAISNKNVLVDLNTVRYSSVSKDLINLYSNNANIYLYCTDITKTLANVQNLLNSKYPDNNFEIQFNNNDCEDFVGCSLQPIEDGRTAVIYYFDSENLKAENCMAMMVNSKIEAITSSEIISPLSASYNNDEYISVYDDSYYFEALPTIVHNTHASELQITYQFERVAVGDYETVWDITNKVYCTPKNDYQSYYMTSIMYTGSAEGETLAGFAPAATSGTSTKSYEFSVGISKNGIEAVVSNSYSITLPDVICTPTYSSAEGRCRWLYEFDEGTYTAKNSTSYTNIVRVLNTKGNIEISFDGKYALCKPYWLIGGYKLSTMSSLYFEDTLPGATLSFKDIK